MVNMPKNPLVIFSMDEAAAAYNSSLSSRSIRKQAKLWVQIPAHPSA
jgi:hypothetical protein